MEMTNKLNDTYWSQRYEANQIGWDIGAPSTPIKTYCEQIENKGQRILIPGCGNAHEAKFLLENGFTNVTLVDISKVLVEKLQKELASYIDLGFCKVFHLDFFNLTDTFDLVIEQTFFCALDPSLRTAYVNKMYEILAPKGKIVGLLFNRDFEGGPPFGGNMKEYRSLFASKFEIVKLEESYNSIPPRQGVEVFINFCKQSQSTN
ncbi:Thiopurine S-methyltransferase (TPMT) [Spirosomataceae bacterium TFI 002]|nr:Thiopurine S-methyltransferase (TPMT) [Spirosomataceae bacterium TFI 002]